ncbi:hypothetical protein HNS38_19910 [Lentimicrobium sp. L6]|uniref:hypothetical protein n=1 Tax=Lentimicrobium sp. L6 TaxID=2735916 RepID=UPI001553A612|nr:hypothetical protein [Lentimicrobium sp. L6]NPD87024.1 hypothetical protein [Lentimicrobium sp. L6]
MRVLLFTISLILIIKGFSQDLVPNKSIFDKEIELSIEYLNTTMSQSEGLELEIDTNEYLSYKAFVKPQENDNYAVSLTEFIPKMEFSNFESLNALYYDFIKEQQYDFECDFRMSNPKIDNLDYISELSEKYKPKIDKAKTDLHINPSNNMVYYKDVSIPKENLEIINKCIILLSPIFEGYTINLTKGYDYPHEVHLSHLNISLNDTLFYKTKSLSNEIQQIEICVHSDSDEIKKVLIDDSDSENTEASIEKLEIFNSIKYNIDKTSGKIIRISIKSGMNSSSEGYEMNLEYRIKYGG